MNALPTHVKTVLFVWMASMVTNVSVLLDSMVLTVRTVSNVSPEKECFELDRNLNIEFTDFKLNWTASF